MYCTQCRKCTVVRQYGIVRHMDYKPRRDLAYLAGFIDGEGHFYVPNVKNGRGESTPYPRIVVAQKNREPLDWCKERWGGYVQKRVNKDGNYCHYWYLTGKKAELLAHKLVPYLIVKREQVKRITERYSTTYIP